MVKLDPKIASLVINLNKISYIKTTSSCQGHGTGEKVFSVGFAMPSKNENKSKLFNFFYGVLSLDSRINLRLSVSKNWILYFKYSREKTFLESMKKIKKLVRKEIKEEDELEPSRS